MFLIINSTPKAKLECCFYANLPNDVTILVHYSYTNAKGNVMYFQKSGNGSPILFLHGWGCDGSIFDSVVKYLPKNSNYVIDFVGFGKSENPPESGWSVFDYAKDVVQFLDEQNLQNVTIVAHSFGCRIAILLGALYSNRVKKLLLFAPAGIRKPSLKRWCKVTKYKICKFLCRMGFSQNLTARYGSVDYNACESSVRNTFVKVVNQDLSKYAKMVTCPTLIINGKNDTQTPLKHAKLMHKLIKNSALVEIDGDHFALFQNPQALARTILLFEGDEC